MPGFKFTIDINPTLQSIKNYSQRVKDNVDDELTAVAYQIQGDAINAAPVDDGNLKTSIQVVRNEPFLKEVEAGANYSAYVEFGTGTGVDITPNLEGLAQYAMQFKGRGIKQVNLPARPYFYPAVLKNTIDLEKKIKAICDD